MKLTRSEVNERHTCNQWTLAAAVLRVLPKLRAMIERQAAEAQMKLEVDKW